MLHCQRASTKTREACFEKKSNIWCASDAHLGSKGDIVDYRHAACFVFHVLEDDDGDAVCTDAGIHEVNYADLVLFLVRLN